MKEKKIKIIGLHDVYEFLTHTAKVEGDVTLFKGIYAVDAKSILGVFSMDLSNEVRIQYPEDAIEFDKYLTQFEI